MRCSTVEQSQSKLRTFRLGAPARPEEPAPGDYVMCSVADTGTGIPDDILDKVFEPFFTTKEVGKGSGLGLPQVLGVAKQLGGGVRIQTRPGAGTTVNVYLPRAREDLAPSEASATGRESCANTGAISFRRAMVLLVDDDNDVRAAATGMLRYAGH